MTENKDVQLQNQVDSLKTSKWELIMERIFLERELNRLKEENKKLKIGIAISERWGK